MPPAETVQDETLHFQLLKELDQAPQQSQRALSSALGISLGKLNYCLRALVMKGWVKAGNFRRNPDKRRYVYLLTPEGIEAKVRLAASFLHRKMAEYDQLGREIETLRQELQLVSHDKNESICCRYRPGWRSKPADRKILIDWVAAQRLRITKPLQRKRS